MHSGLTQRFCGFSLILVLIIKASSRSYILLQYSRLQPDLETSFPFLLPTFFATLNHSGIFLLDNLQLNHLGFQRVSLHLNRPVYQVHSLLPNQVRDLLHNPALHQQLNRPLSHLLNLLNNQYPGLLANLPPNHPDSLVDSRLHNLQVNLPVSLLPNLVASQFQIPLVNQPHNLSVDQQDNLVLNHHLSQLRNLSVSRQVSRRGNLPRIQQDNQVHNHLGNRHNNLFPGQQVSPRPNQLRNQLPNQSANHPWDLQPSLQVLPLVNPLHNPVIIPQHNRLPFPLVNLLVNRRAFHLLNPLDFLLWYRRRNRPAIPPNQRDNLLVSLRTQVHNLLPCQLIQLLNPPRCQHRNPVVFLPPNLLQCRLPLLVNLPVNQVLYLRLSRRLFQLRFLRRNPLQCHLYNHLLARARLPPPNPLAHRPRNPLLNLPLHQLTDLRRNQLRNQLLNHQSNQLLTQLVNPQGNQHLDLVPSRLPSRPLTQHLVLQFAHLLNLHYNLPVIQVVSQLLNLPFNRLLALRHSQVPFQLVSLPSNLVVYHLLNLLHIPLSRPLHHPVHLRLSLPFNRPLYQLRNQVRFPHQFHQRSQVRCLLLFQLINPPQRLPVFRLPFPLDGLQVNRLRNHPSPLHFHPVNQLALLHPDRHRPLPPNQQRSLPRNRVANPLPLQPIILPDSRRLNQALNPVITRRINPRLLQLCSQRLFQVLHLLLNPLASLPIARAVTHP